MRHHVARYIFTAFQKEEIGGDENLLHRSLRLPFTALIYGSEADRRLSTFIS